MSSDTADTAPSPTGSSAGPLLGLDGEPLRIGVLTSGGDAQGMNAAVRAVVRTAIRLEARPYAIMEGWAGAVAGGDGIRPLEWNSMGSILQRGGTIIDTARSAEFRERADQLAAARNLLEHNIDRLVVIGGDSSLIGTNEFRKNWPSLLEELVETGDISAEAATSHPVLTVTGLVGSIDNDLVGVNMTIGTDSALHRILETIDDISSTAVSHQCTFVVGVMGRHRGYLIFMAAAAGDCDCVLAPELSPGKNWEEDMCSKLRTGRGAGHRESMVIVAEGATDREGNRITVDGVRRVIADKLGEAARITILGRVQRGGRPSAYDRWISTLLGCAAVCEVVSMEPGSEPVIIAERHNRICRLPIMEQIVAARTVKDLAAAQDYLGAIQARGVSFGRMLKLFETMSTPPAEPTTEAGSIPSASDHLKRIAIIHAGGLAPGMNTAMRAAMRLGIDYDSTMLGAYGGFPGLLDDDVRELTWADAEGWAGDGSTQPSTRREMPTTEQLCTLGRAVELHEIDALLAIGGYNAYLSAYRLVTEQDRCPVFQIPIVCVPVSIDNNLSGSELSIGTDTVLNNAVVALGSIKLSAAASHRRFVAEVMSRKYGYLSLMSGLATGAEKVYLNEEGVTLADLAADSERMVKSFRPGRSLYLVIRNERTSVNYTTDVLAHIFAEEGRGPYDVREVILGHQQQGGSPTAFDRIMATKLVAHSLELLAYALKRGEPTASYVGPMGGKVSDQSLDRMNDDFDHDHHRPRHQWWLGLRPAVGLASQDIGTLSPQDVPNLGEAVDDAAS